MPRKKERIGKQTDEKYYSNYSKIILITLILILFSGLVYAVECVVPTNGMDIIEDTKFCKGEYYLPDGLSIKTNNIVLDCNDAKLIGDYNEFQGGTTGIKVEGIDGVTIKDCRVDRYGFGLYFMDSDNNTISDSIFQNSHLGIVLENDSNYNIFKKNEIKNNMDGGVYVPIGYGINSALPSNYNQYIDNIANDNGETGFRLETSSFNIFKGNTANNNTNEGFDFWDGSNNNSVINNIANNNKYYGIYFVRSYHNLLKENKISGNKEGIIVLSGSVNDQKIHYDNSIDTSNKVNNKPIYYIFDSTDITLDNKDTNQIFVAWSEDITIKNNNMVEGASIRIQHTNYSKVYNNRINSRFYSLYFFNSNFGEVKSNEFKNGWFGILLDSGGDFNIIKNNIKNNDFGIEVREVKDVRIEDNIIRDNMGIGVSISPGYTTNMKEGLVKNNKFIGNGFGDYYFSPWISYYRTAIHVGGWQTNYTFTANDFIDNYKAIKTVYTKYHIFFNNNFLNNTYDTDIDLRYPHYNKWDNGSEGNYWDRYDDGTEGCFDINNDSICDSSYFIAHLNSDNFPLTKPILGEDEDNDGIPNSEDKCPDTEEEQIVYGCSCKQILKLKPGEDSSEECSKGIIEVFTKQIGWAKDLFG